MYDDEEPNYQDEPDFDFGAFLAQLEAEAQSLECAHERASSRPNIECEFRNVPEEYADVAEKLANDVRSILKTMPYGCVCVITNNSGDELYVE